MSCDSDTAVPRKCAPGVPAWVLTFADLMSLLLSFFVLLFSFSEMDANKYKQVAGSMSEAFGVQREIKVKDPPKGINIIATEFSAGVPQEKSVNRMEQVTSDDFRQYLRIPKLRDDSKSREKIDPNRVVTKPRPSAAFTDALKQEKDRLALALAKEIKEGYIEIEVKGRNIIIRIQERGTFASGSNQLIEPFRAVLMKMAHTIGDTPGLVVVAGHTDSRPIHTDYFRSNWELSASRAVTVVHVLMQEGSIPEQRFRIEGYGDTRPIASNDTPEGRARNRRVEVSLHFDESLVDRLHAGGRNPALPGEKPYRDGPGWPVTTGVPSRPAAVAAPSAPGTDPSQTSATGPGNRH